MKRSMPDNRKALAWVFEGDCIRCLSHSKNAHGYPQLRRKGSKFHTIARRILFRRYGEQPDTIHARHTCDNRWCINPDHIIPGTTQDNTADKVARGRTRTPRGEQNGLSKLTNQDILDIRSSNETQSVIASRFGIDQSNVHYIRSRKTWSHIL